MPREGKMDSLVFPHENLRGLKGLITCNNKNKVNHNNFNCGGVATEDIINDSELALRKAGEAGIPINVLLSFAAFSEFSRNTFVNVHPCISLYCDNPDQNSSIFRM